MIRQDLWRLSAPLVAPIWRSLPLRLRRAILWAATAKFLVGVAGVCLNDRNQVLLLSHRFHTADSLWGLPGGWMSRGESPEETLRRELYEETGLRVEIVEPLLTDGDGEWVELIYLCRVDGDPVSLQTEELTGWRWSNPATVDLPMRPSHRRALQMIAARSNL
jgi:8-oxo-dGTP pyrophosphatase MutT (NUDIX family)